MLNETWVATDQQVSRRCGEEAIVLSLEHGAYFGLDELGSRIWDLLQTPRSGQMLCDILVGEYQVERPRLESDLTSFLQALREEALIEQAEADSGSGGELS